MLRYEENLNIIEVTTLAALIQHIEDVNPGYVLRLHSIDDASDGTIVTLAVESSGGRSSNELRALKEQLEETWQALISAQSVAREAQDQRDKIEFTLRHISHEVLPSLVVSDHGVNSLKINGLIS